MLGVILNIGDSKRSGKDGMQSKNVPPMFFIIWIKDE